MKLTKTIIMAAVTLLAAHGSFAADSYLYWMASDTIINYLGKERGDTTPVVWDYAKVKYGDNYLTMGNGVSDRIDREDAITAASWWGAFTYTKGSEFLFELYLEDNSLVGFLGTQWIPAGAIGNGSSATGDATFVLTGVVPEPTSGLLSLFGLAALALRRRRRV